MSLADTRTTRAAERQVLEQDWGRLEWSVSGELGNSDVLTFGRCIIRPGEANPRHLHPNCDEVLHVIQGSIEHSLGNERFPLGAGDTISIPRGTLHNARNIGAVDAVLIIAFDTAHREVVGE